METTFKKMSQKKMPKFRAEPCGICGEPSYGGVASDERGNGSIVYVCQRTECFAEAQKLLK